MGGRAARKLGRSPLERRLIGRRGCRRPEGASGRRRISFGAAAAPEGAGSTNPARGGTRRRGASFLGTQERHAGRYAIETTAFVVKDPARRVRSCWRRRASCAVAA